MRVGGEKRGGRENIEEEKVGLFVSMAKGVMSHKYCKMEGIIAMAIFNKDKRP